MSVLVAIDAMFVDSAHLATMSSAATSTLLSADKGEGVKTGENEGEFMATNNFALSSTLLIDYVLVRAKSLPHLGKYQLFIFQGAFSKDLCRRDWTVFSRTGVLCKFFFQNLCYRCPFAEHLVCFFCNLQMLLFPLIEYVKAEEMLEWMSRRKELEDHS